MRDGRYEGVEYHTRVFGFPPRVCIASQYFRYGCELENRSGKNRHFRDRFEKLFIHLSLNHVLLRDCCIVVVLFQKKERGKYVYIYM